VDHSDQLAIPPIPLPEQNPRPMGMNATVDDSLQHIHPATNNSEVGALPSIVLRQLVNPDVCITTVRICLHILVDFTLLNSPT
jgi:hypothetical protein